MGDVLNICPRCSEDLPWNSTSCRCGWKKRRSGEKSLAPRVHIPCAHYDCIVDATIRVKTPTGMANLCPGHYTEHWRRQAADYVASIGLKTTTEKRAWCLEKLRGIGRQPPSHAWMDRINQRGVDVLAASGNRDAIAMLLRRGVIDGKGAVIEPALRRPMIEREAGQDDEEVAFS